MTHSELVQKVARWVKKHDQNVLVPNCPHCYTEPAALAISGEIPDVIGFCHWASVMVEVKVSRSDFLRDKRKKFRKFPKLGVGGFRFFCCPEGLIEENEIPENWGLLWLNSKNKIEMIVTPKEQASNLQTERTILLSVIRRQMYRKR